MTEIKSNQNQREIASTQCQWLSQKKKKGWNSLEGRSEFITFRIMTWRFKWVAVMWSSIPKFPRIGWHDIDGSGDYWRLISVVIPLHYSMEDECNLEIFFLLMSSCIDENCCKFVPRSFAGWYITTGWMPHNSSINNGDTQSSNHLFLIEPQAI